jgi:hypothetical protein
MVVLVVGMLAFALPWRANSSGGGPDAEQATSCRLPPGHPAVTCSDAAPALPPGHPPIEGRAAPALPPGHPPIGSAPATRPGFVNPDLGGSGPRIFAL